MSPCLSHKTWHNWLSISLNHKYTEPSEPDRFEKPLPWDWKKEEDTHSWPFHSCARASSGCRTCVRPDRRTAPVLWSRRGASPSGSPSAWSSYISPLEARKQDRRKKGWKVVRRETAGICTATEKKYDRQKCAYMFSFKRWVCVFFHQIPSGLSCKTQLFTFTLTWTQQCKANALDTLVTADRVSLVSWEEEKGREDRRQREAISPQKAL